MLSVIASRMSTPAGSRRTRSMSSSKRSATSAAGAVASTLMARSSASCESSAPASRRSAVALPPEATARSIGGVTSPSKQPEACWRTAFSSRTAGGSECR